MINLVWHPVIRLPLEKDMRPLLAYLEAQALLHHVTEEGGEQQLWISDEPRIIDVAELTANWLAGEVDLSRHLVPESKAEGVQASETHPINAAIKLIKLVPVTLTAIFLGFLGALIIFADDQNLSYAEPFLFQAIQDGYFVSFAETMASGQYWRLLTPIFLHFTLLHIIFNSLILWEIGRRIELVKGPSHILLIIISVGVMSNFAQYMTQQNTIFGGLSGVVYGVIGYIAVYQQFIYHPVLQFNKAAIAFFIVWLLLGALGIIDVFISGSIANAAHVVGLISGAIIGLFVMLMDRNGKAREK
ncbi:MAG: GlpG protein [Cellvibrionaceae bacterium]|jgi:GlpG protein